MRRSRPGIGSELFPLALILIGLGGTLGLVVRMHQLAVARRAAEPKTSVVAVVPTPAQAPALPVVAEPREPDEPEAPPPPVVVAPPPPPAEDPTVAVLARIDQQADEQRRAAREADQKAASLETAIKAATAETQRWRRREALVRSQADRMADRAAVMEMEADSLAMERDVLARELDASKAALAKAKSRGGGYAVMPNKSPNGTWQRPVMIECRDGQAILQPRGLAFSMLDLSGLMSSRSNPFVMAVGRELIRAGRTNSPDGAPVVPYIYFIIRPDGIRPYYEARGRLEPLGMAFGYELVEADWEIEFPDFDAIDAWDGSASPHSDNPNRGGRGGGGIGGGSGGATPGTPGGFTSTGRGPAQVAGAQGFVWPTDRGGSGAGQNQGQGAGRGGAGQTGRGPGSGQATDDLANANGFVWPADRPGGAGNGAGLWPTQAPGSAGAGMESGTGSGTVPPLEMVGDLPGGGGSGASGSVPPLEMADGSPAGSTRGTPGNGSGTRPTTPAGLVPLGPDGLPNLDRPGASGGMSRSSPAPGAGGIPGAARAASPGGMPPSPAGNGLTSAAGGNPLPKLPNAAPPPGWVRLDPAMLARAVDGDFHDPDRPPAQPSRLMPGNGGSGSGGSTSPTNSTSTGGGDGQPASSAGGGGAPTPPGSGPGIPSFGASGPGPQGDYRPKPKTSRGWSPLMSRTISVPLDLVVACGPDGVVVHPGGYRLSRAALAKDGALSRDLQTIVRNHEMIDASVRPVPRVQFLVEPGGSETYRLARRQTVLAGFPWPVSLQVAGAQPSSLFPKERF